jgi:hypothetical protein
MITDITEVGGKFKHSCVCGWSILLSARAYANCPKCSRKAKKKKAASRHLVCKHLGSATGEVFPPKDGLGDAFEAGLNAIHVTKENWASAKAFAANLVGIEIDKEASCGSCDKKQKWLNAFGQKLGIGKKSAAIASLLNLEAGAALPVFGCAVYGRCVPAKSLQGIDGAPHSCQGCKEKDLVSLVQLLPAPPAE